MSNRSTSYDNLDDALAALEVHSVASSSVAASTSGAAAAPSTPIRVQGTSVGGDDTANVGVVVIEPDSSLCCGIIGNPGRICLMEKKEGTDSCGVAHRGGRLRIKSAGLYIKDRSSKTAHLDVAWLVRQEATTKQWTKLFSIFSTASQLTKEEVERRLAMLDHPSPMATPWKASLDPEQIIELPNKAGNYYERLDSAAIRHLEEKTSVQCAASLEELDSGLARVSASLNSVA